VAPLDFDRKAKNGIPWGYLLSYTTLILYTFVLTLRYGGRGAAEEG
jgi:hypothetical protein